MYPPPTRITSLPLITLAMIDFVPNLYLPGPVRTTLMVQLLLARCLAISSSTGSPLTNLYLILGASAFGENCVVVGDDTIEVYVRSS